MDPSIKEYCLTIQLDTECNKRSAVKFTYSQEIVAFLKTLEKYYYNGFEKYWTFKLQDVEKVATFASDLGYQVKYGHFADPSPKYDLAPTTQRDSAPYPKYANARSNQGDACGKFPLKYGRN